MSMKVIFTNFVLIGGLVIFGASLRADVPNVYVNQFPENMIQVVLNSQFQCNFFFEKFSRVQDRLYFNASGWCPENPEAHGRTSQIAVQFENENAAIMIAELFSHSGSESMLIMELGSKGVVSGAMDFQQNELRFFDVDGMTNDGETSVEMSIPEIVQWAQTHLK